MNNAAYPQFNECTPNLSDSQITEAIRAVASNLNLVLAFRPLSAQFRTVYLYAPLDVASPRVLLRAAFAHLNAAGVNGVTLTAVENVDHPDYGRPMLEIDSVWWSE